MTELAQAEHVRRQSMAETVAALRAGGLVSAAKDPNDGRKSLFSATPAGADLCERIPAAREAWLAEVTCLPIRRVRRPGGGAGRRPGAGPRAGRLRARSALERVSA